MNDEFNVIRSIKITRSGANFNRVKGFTYFNQFIESNCLVDLPLCGRRFMWYQGDDLSMVRLDQFLLSYIWVSLWPNCIQVDFPRTISNHFPILMSINEENWGPRPTRMLKCLADLPGYKEFMK